MSDLSLEALAQTFQRFAREEVRDASPLYEKLSLSIAEDPEILALAAHARNGERIPNLFFAAVQFLLLNGIKHPVSVFYRMASGAAASKEDPYPKFRSFCLEYDEEIRGLIAVGLVQTNEVSRCAFLAPAFVFISRQGQGQPLYLVEIGASAGLNLLWDRYGYRFGEICTGGNLNSPVQITCALRGNGQPPIPEKFPAIATRVGLDRIPIEMGDPDAVLWLRAFIWPEQVKRAELLKRAIQIARQNPVKLIAGDAAETLPAILAEAPEDNTLCIFRTFTPLSPPSRERISEVCARCGASRDLFLLSTTGGRSIDSELKLVSFINGVKTERILARCHNHGQWLEWLDVS
jgi:hypothetical protein